MTEPSKTPIRLRDLAPHLRRRVWLRAGARSLLLSVALLVLYFLWPIDQAPNSGREISALLVSLTVFAVVFVLQVRSIKSSRLPEARTIEALAVVMTLFVVLMSVIYLYMDDSMSQAFSQPLTRMGALYFTVTVLTTVGFGDISAATDATRAAVTVQMVLNTVFVGVLVKVLVGVGKASVGGAASAAEEGQTSAQGAHPD